MVDRHSH